MFEGKTVYILSPNEWGSMFVSKHHYAVELARRGSRVVFINPPSTDLPFGVHVREEVEGIQVVDHHPIYRGRSVLPRFAFDGLKRAQIRWIEHAVGHRADVVWSFDPIRFSDLTWFRGAIRIFHPVDDLRDDASALVAHTSHINVSCSHRIVQQIEAVGEPCERVGHGLAQSFVDYPFSEPSVERPVVGYVGNLLMPNLDRDLIRQLVSDHPAVVFHFAGPLRIEDSNVAGVTEPEVHAFIQFLLDAPNVTCHGVIPSHEIPAFLDRCSMLIVCYRASAMNAISNSHKIVEYLASGRAIVTTPISDYASSDLMLMSDGSHDSFWDHFAEATRILDTLNRPDLVQRRRQFAMERSYARRIDAIEQLVRRALEPRPQ